MKNFEVAQLLYKIADLLEIENVQWKPQAYRKAAQNIESLGTDIAEMYKQGRLDDIPGVGSGIRKKIEDYLKHGKSAYYQQLKKKTPVDVEKLMQIPGLGPKKIKMLYKKLKITTISELERAAKHQKLQKLEGMGEKSEKEILEGIARMRESKGRMLIGFAVPVGRELIALLKKRKDVSDAELVGSYRRAKESIGDFDILVVAKQNDNKTIMSIMNYFANLPMVKKIDSKGPKRTSVVLKEGIDADLRVFKKSEFGAAMLYFTGSKVHNILLRKLAMSKKMKLNEYGLFKGRRVVAGRTEKQIYSKLGLQYIPPELREAQGEIQKAKERKIPHLVCQSDIKGDLQMHSIYSDGANTIKEMALAARQIGHKYIAMTDHAGRLRIANAMTVKKIKKQWREIERINKKLNGIKILKGVEVNILQNGALDISKKLLSGFDIILLAIHSAFKLSSREQTNRIINAVSMGHGNILAHPTGRLISKRAEMKFDMEQVMQVCKEKKVAMELNCYTNRLDLRDVYLRKAGEMGCKISLGTDAHSVDSLRFIDIGVGMARRGWLKPDDIINTMNYAQLKKWLK